MTPDAWSYLAAVDELDHDGVLALLRKTDRSLESYTAMAGWQPVEDVDQAVAGRGYVLIPLSDAQVRSVVAQIGSLAPHEGGDSVSTKILLRDEVIAYGIRSVLAAYLDDQGHLHLDAQDLGLPGPDGEYEYWRTIRPENIAALIELLDGEPGDEILDLLTRGWSGRRSLEMERRFVDAVFPVEFHSHGSGPALLAQMRAMSTAAAQAIAKEMMVVRGTGQARVIQIADLYLQFASYEADEMAIELPANEFLPEERQLDAAARFRLTRLGFDTPGTFGPNWSLTFEDATDQELDEAAGAVVTAITEIYRVPLVELLIELAHSDDEDTADDFGDH